VVSTHPPDLQILLKQPQKSSEQQLCKIMYYIAQWWREKRMSISVVSSTYCHQCLGHNFCYSHSRQQLQQQSISASSCTTRAGGDRGTWTVSYTHHPGWQVCV